MITLDDKQQEDLENIMGSAYVNTFENVVGKVPGAKVHPLVIMAKAQWIVAFELLGFKAPE